MKGFWKITPVGILSLLNIAIFAGFMMMGLTGKTSFSPVDAEKINILSADSNERIEIGFFDGKAQIRFLNEKGNATLSLQGGKEPMIALYDGKGAALASFLVNSHEEAQMLFNDDHNANRLEIKGGALPAIYLKTPQEAVVGSWSLFQEGGCGFGLAQSNGMVSAILRGGDKPGLAFYDQSDLPGAVFGLLEKVPHLLVAGATGEEGVLIHGGKPSGMMFMDENGQLKVFISKHGIYQGKDKSAMEQPKEKQKLFSLEGNLKTLFPKKGERR